MSKPITDAREAIKNIRSACGIIAMLQLDRSLTDAEVATACKFILEQLEPLEAALPVVANLSVPLPLLSLADISAQARRARPALSCIEGGAS
jgi:hypothetical protein